MATLMNDGAAPRLERSCGSAGADWIRIAPSSPGLERVEAFFCGHAFDPHRHDTYAVGFTVQGVQSFRYRGAAEHSLARQVFVLHPDETRDGRDAVRAGATFPGVPGPQPLPVPRHAAPRSGARADPAGYAARRCGRVMRLRRPEPYDAPFQAGLRSVARSMGRGHAHRLATA